MNKCKKKSNLEFLGSILSPENEFGEYSDKEGQREEEDAQDERVLKVI